MSYGLGAWKGGQAYKQGATGLEAVNVGLAWRYWYKAAGFGLFLIVVSMFSLPWGAPWGSVELLVLPTWWLLILGVTYAKLPTTRGGFLARLFWHLAKHVRNVSNFWLYMLYAAPFWFNLYVKAHIQGVI